MLKGILYACSYDIIYGKSGSYCLAKMMSVFFCNKLACTIKKMINYLPKCTILFEVGFKFIKRQFFSITILFNNNSFQ